MRAAVKVAKLAIVSCVVFGAISAQAQTPKAGGKVNVIVTPEPPLLMLGMNQNAPTTQIASNIYESLLRFDEKLKPLPSLAKSWEVSSDAKTYTFKLQENVKWHDGVPFSADDVVFSLDKFLREMNSRWRVQVNARVDKIEKIDDKTVVLKMKESYRPLLLAMETASAPIVPKHLYEGTDFKANPANNHPIGTGPFKFKEWKKGSYVHLVKNTDYYLPNKPYLDELYYQFIPDAASRAVAYETGQVDVLVGGSIDYFDVQRLSKLPNTCVTTKGWEIYAPHAWIVVNHRSGILGNRQFRQGLMYAIDREFGRNAIWAGFGKVPTGPISSKTKYYTADVKQYEYDPKKAKELIQASGYKGETIRFLGLPYGETWSRWAEAIKQNLAEVGVNVAIETTDVPGWGQKVGNWDYDLTFNFAYQYGDPAVGVARYYLASNISKGNPFVNTGGYANPESDKLFDEAAIAETDEKRQELYTKLQKLHAEDLPLLWLLEMEYPTVYRCNIKNFITTAIGVNDGFRDAWKE